MVRDLGQPSQLENSELGQPDDLHGSQLLVAHLALGEKVDAVVTDVGAACQVELLQLEAHGERLAELAVEGLLVHVGALEDLDGVLHAVEDVGEANRGR